MKKKWSYKDRSQSVRCKKCSRGIKIRLLAIKEKTPTLCYKCYINK